MLDLVFKNYTSQKSPAENFFRDILGKSVKTLKLKGKLELSVNLVGEAKIKELSKKHRHKNKPTDVLSFPVGNGNGDIFICLSIAKNKAKRENVSIERKLAQLTVHGFLHLQGYDHEVSEASARKMFGLERRILDKIKL